MDNYNSKIASVKCQFSHYIPYPLVDEGHVLKNYFPDIYYAQSAPILFAYTVFSFTFAYIGIILVRTSGAKDKWE